MVVVMGFLGSMMVVTVPVIVVMTYFALDCVAMARVRAMCLMKICLCKHSHYGE